MIKQVIIFKIIFFNNYNLKMGRRKIDINIINNGKDRKITFKKRRFGLIKKAMELEALTNC